MSGLRGAATEERVMEAGGGWGRQPPLPLRAGRHVDSPHETRPVIVECTTSYHDTETYEHIYPFLT